MQEHEHYTYIYLDPTRPGIFDCTAGSFFFEPYYVGKGSGKRIEDHMQNLARCKNTAMRGRTRKLHEQNPDWPYRMKVATFDNASDAYDMEEKLIEEFGSRFVSQIKDGPLLNMAAGGAKPRSQRGRSYKDIYGERADEQREKRNVLQMAAGGWFKGGHHTEESRARIGAKSRERQANGGARTGIPHSEEVKKVIAEANMRSPARRTLVVLEDPDLNQYLVYRMAPFCTERNISKSTIEKAYAEGWDGIQSGKTKGWRKITQMPFSNLSDLIPDVLSNIEVHHLDLNMASQDIKDRVAHHSQHRHP